MAELIHIRGVDFRGYRKFSVDLRGNGLFLVAGPTNSGKSAFLSAFDIVAGREFTDSVRHAQGFNSRVTARWSLNDEERALILGQSDDLHGLLADADTAHWMEWVFSEHEGFIRPTRITIQWASEERTIALLQSRSPGSFEFSTADFPLTNEDHDLTQRSSGGGSHPSDTLHHFQGYASGIPHNILTEWRKGYFHFQPLRESAGRKVALSGVTPLLETNGSNLATVLLHLYTNRPDVWQELQTHVTSIVPDVGQLMVPVENTSVEVVFKDSSSGVRHNLKDLGSGVEQLLMLLVVGLTESANVVLLEEPETGLHPSAQRALLTLLQTWSAGRLFLASTHSAALLDWHSPNTSVLAVSRTEGNSAVAPVTTERTTLLQELGVRLSDVLSAERVLIVEGPTDKEILDTWFPSVLNNPRIVIIRGGGGYNARHAKLFAAWLDKADGELGQRRVLYVRDRDELSAEFLATLEASENVYVLPCRELENLMLDDKAIQTVINAERERLGKETVTVEEISSASRELADELQQVVVLKQAMADLADPIRLVDNKLRGKLAKESADKAALSAEVLARVPTAEEIEEKISSTWEQHEREASSNWDAEWKNLAPGADVLNGLWTKYLDRGYKKSKDGLALAEAMDEPPQVLRELLDKFMQENS
ncbi:AAA family ATPase [Streptomyces sp. AC555_RSS877]|uniref:AAA family ATPase n=1 Tax=Streptomyces sp. AC555_RSS877 TaxID=2823688 RepID=UPI001C2640DF|nr:AAA family ATPase [Streptomyces sp. AC555_RSS877]